MRADPAWGRGADGGVGAVRAACGRGRGEAHEAAVVLAESPYVSSYALSLIDLWLFLTTRSFLRGPPQLSPRAVGRRRCEPIASQGDTPSGPGLHGRTFDCTGHFLSESLEPPYSPSTALPGGAVSRRDRVGATEWSMSHGCVLIARSHFHESFGGCHKVNEVCPSPLVCLIYCNIYILNVAWINKHYLVLKRND